MRENIAAFAVIFRKIMSPIRIIQHICLLGSLGIGCFMSQAALAGMMQVSWYGPGFHGNPTASGEVFDRWEHTAAHPSWPFGTLVRLTNPRNGQSVTVRINDRSGGVLDISEQAARDLGTHSRGVATVEVEVLDWGR